MQQRARVHRRLPLLPHHRAQPSARRDQQLAAGAAATARASPLDYSRFEKIDVSDDEEPPRVEPPYAARSIEFCHPSTWKPPRAPVARASDVSHPSSRGGGHGLS